MNIQSEFPFQNPSDSKRRTLVLRICAAIGLSLVVLLASIFPQVTQAAPLLLIVDRFDDDPGATACTGINPSDCSLRGAIIAAFNNPGTDTITLQAGTYLLDEFGTGENWTVDGDLDINSNLIINGAGQTKTIIDANGAVTEEHVFHIFGSWTVEFTDLTITHGSGNWGGIVNLGTLTLTNVTVDENFATLSGGGIYSSNSLTLVNSTVSNNEATGGGGLYVPSGTVTITSSTFSGNTATGTTQGGAMMLTGGTTTINSGSQIASNQAGVGGGISSSGTLTVNDSSIYMNQASIIGGGIYIGSGSTTLNNTSVSRNDSTGIGSSGGGIMVYGSLEIHGGEVALNSAGYDGGGISMYSPATVNIYDANINDNHTTEDPSYGGGIHNTSGQLALYDSIVRSNWVSGTPSTSFSDGGGIESSGGDLTLAGSMILENYAIDSGGGVSFSYGTLNITNSVFRTNEVVGSFGAGGGLFNGSGSTAVLRQVEFSGNTSGYTSAGVHNQAAISLENVTISGNSAQYGSGMVNTGSGTASIVNSTIFGNTVTSGVSSGGLVVYTDITIQNTIVAGNANDECLDFSGTTHILSAGNNLSSDNTCSFSAGGDQPNTDPLLAPLVYNGGLSKTHVLLPSSPAIDAGTNSSCPAVDQRGINRPIDGDTNGTATCDVGALELQLKIYLPLISR